MPRANTLRLSYGEKVNLKTTSYQSLPVTMVEKTVNAIKNHWVEGKLKTTNTSWKVPAGNSHL